MALDLTETNDNGDRWWILKHNRSNNTVAWLIFGSLEFAISEVDRLQRYYDSCKLDHKWSTTLAETFHVASGHRIIVHDRGNSTQRGEYR